MTTNKPQFPQGDNILSPGFRERLNDLAAYVSSHGGMSYLDRTDARLFQVATGQTWALSTTDGVTDDVTSALCDAVQLTAPGAATNPNTYSERGDTERVYNSLVGDEPTALGDLFWAVFNTQSGRWEMIYQADVVVSSSSASSTASISTSGVSTTDCLLGGCPSGVADIWELTLSGFATTGAVCFCETFNRTWTLTYDGSCIWSETVGGSHKVELRWNAIGSVWQLTASVGGICSISYGWTSKGASQFNCTAMNRFVSTGTGSGLCWNTFDPGDALVYPV